MIFLPDSAELVGTVRLATADDVPFLDHLQDKFSHQLGYLPRQALESNAVKGHVWIGFENGQPAGYVLGKAPYKGREDVGIIYQSALEYDAQRKSIGTQLVEAWVGSLSKSVRQVICWCAQDIEANRFWEALDFLPLGYRAGSAKKQRVHIYWNRPIDVHLQELWIPDHTANGLLRGPREITLLEPGQLWSDRIRVDWMKVEATMLEVQAAAVVNKQKREADRAAAAAKRQQLDEVRIAAAVHARAAELLHLHLAAQPVTPPGMVRVLVSGKHVLRPALPR